MERQTDNPTCADRPLLQCHIVAVDVTLPAIWKDDFCSCPALLTRAAVVSSECAKSNLQQFYSQLNSRPCDAIDVAYSHASSSCLASLSALKPKPAYAMRQRPRNLLLNNKSAHLILQEVHHLQSWSLAVGVNLFRQANIHCVPARLKLSF